jgi:serine/threonine protein kinase
VHRQFGERVAIKQYDRFKLMEIHRKKQAIREIRILSRLNHPNIIRLMESIDSPKYVYMVMELAQGESLHANLKATPHRRFTEDKAKRLIKQMLSILLYLHQRNVTHRDIKLENIIIDKRGVIKLIDFGFCCCSSKDVKLKIFCGTPSYMCPEIV